LAIFAALAAIAIGLARLLQQRQYPPEWAKAHLFEGFVAIDGYAERALLLREWLAGLDPGGVLLSGFLQRDGHTTTVTIPAATALLSCTGLSIPWSYYSVVLALFVGTMHLGGRLAQDLRGGRAARSDSYWLVWWYMALHVTTTRTVGQLLLDWGVACAAVGCALHALRWARGGKLRDAGALMAFLLLGLFTKSSAMPLCALPVLMAFAVPPSTGGTARRFALAAMLPLLVCALATAYAHAVAGGGLFDRDHAGHAGTRVRPFEFAVEMLLLFQAGPLLLWRVRPLSRTALCLLVGLGIACVSVWVFRLPATPRLYLPVLALGVPLAAGVAPGVLGRPLAAIAFAVGNLAITAAVFLRR